MEMTNDILAALISQDSAFQAKAVELAKAHLAAGSPAPKPKAEAPAQPTMEDLHSPDPARKAAARARVVELLGSM
jgi:hypothetical protein